MMGGMRGMGNPADMIKNADTNADGAVDKDEFRAMRNKEADEGFARLDGNSDGKVTADEFRAIAERMRSFMGGRGGPEGMRRPGGGGGEGGNSGGGFRRPPSQEGEKPAPAPEGDKPKGV
jgi:hypothetical protein